MSSVQCSNCAPCSNNAYGEPIQNSNAPCSISAHWGSIQTQLDACTSVNVYGYDEMNTQIEPQSDNEDSTYATDQEYDSSDQVIEKVARG